MILWGVFRHAVLSTVIMFSLSMRAQERMTLADVAQRASANSSLTNLGSSPFRLKAEVSEPAKPQSRYRAEIEEIWVSPNKWKRTVTSPDFSQTIVVNGDRYFERTKGDYSPQWLRELITALFEPLPMLEVLKQTKLEIAAPSGAPGSRSCARFASRVGLARIQNSVYSVFCFAGNPATVISVVTPGYTVEFEDYKRFGTKQVAQRIKSEPEPGLSLQAKIIDLSLVQNPDESLFAVAEVTPSAGRLNVVRVTDAVASSTPAIQWPTVRSGKTAGVLSLYVGVDSTGQVREAWPLSSDNRAMDDSARAQVRNWKFRPVSIQGAPAQFETILTFAFESNIKDATHILTNEEARKLAQQVVEPRFTPGVSSKGTEITVRVSVAADGSIRSTSNPNKVDTGLFLAAMNAVRQWKFHPYLREGKPDTFEADITFRVQ